MQKFSLLVWSEPRDGQEEIYNTWYNDVHLSDVCALPGFTSAKRYEFADSTPTPRKYLAVYDLETDAPDTIIERLLVDTAEMDISPAINVETVIMSVVRQL